VTKREDRHARLLSQLYREYEARFARSREAHDRAQGVLIDGISHATRSFSPFPFRITAARGAYVDDLDGHRISDFWQGHFANILGHNPEVVCSALIAELESGAGLQTGIPEERETVYTQLLAEALGAERVRLTTAGTLATMYAVMLARAHTGRDVVLKVAGGWHGANPLALKGVQRTTQGFDQVDSAGVPITTEQEILVTTFNDEQRLHDVFRASGDQIACFILEPCPSGAGFVPATPAYMKAARELTTQHGALLIVDEVITGFRFCAGPMQRLYGIQADLATYGKIIGGGMPLSAVAGRADIMDRASTRAPSRVWFHGGTFSAHPLALEAGKTMVEHLIAHEDEIYPTLAARTDYLRWGIESVFRDHGILARCTGGHEDGAIHGASLSSVYFPLRDDHYASSAEDLTDPNLCDLPLQDEAIKLGLLLHDVNTVHGLGAVSLAHSDLDIERVLAAYEAFAARAAG
jgi:glutamate-1-semialdehyde 2,1-aminomutase